MADEQIHDEQTHWVTRDGRRLLVKDMTTEHLVNARSHLQEAMEKERWRFRHSCYDDSVFKNRGVCSECAAEELIKSQWLAWIKRFETELSRRAAARAIAEREKMPDVEQRAMLIELN